MGKFGKFAHKQPLFFLSSQPGKSLIFGLISFQSHNRLFYRPLCFTPYTNKNTIRRFILVLSFNAIF